MSWVYAHRYLLARRAAALGILLLLWLGANAQLSVLTGNLSSSWLFGAIPLSDPYAVLQILASGQPLASTVLLGALIVLLFYALVGRLSLLRVGFSSERCDHCGDCVVGCPEPQVIDFQRMAQKGFVDPGDCLNCARCLEVCPRDAYHFVLRSGSGAANDLKEGDHHAMQCRA